MKRSLFFLIFILVLSVPVAAVLGQPNPNLFFGNFGGHVPSGVTWALDEVNPETWYIENHGDLGSTLNISSAALTSVSGSGITVTGLPLGTTALSTYDRDPLTFTCDPEAGGSASDFSIVSDDPDEPNYVIHFTCGDVPLPGPDIIVGNFGLQWPNGLEFGVLPGENIALFLYQSGTPGSILTISDSSFVPSDPRFTITGLPADGSTFAVYPADTFQFTVSCGAGVTTDITALLTFNSDDPDENPFTIPFVCGENVVPPVIDPPVVTGTVSLLGCTPSTMVTSYGQGRMLSTVDALYEPIAGSTTGVIIPAGSAWWVLGAKDGYYEIWISCDADSVWVPADSIGPNYEQPWNGAPLPSSGA
ncbi:MAG: hypothetical protein ABI835_07570 [Chloroflexota bacterium]